MQHATEDEQQELLLPDSTALQAMGVDNLSKLAELLWENGKWYGVGENSAMSQYDLAKAIESGADLAWNRSEMYSGELDMYGGKLEQIKEAWLGKMMENYDKHPDHLKIKVRQLRDLISKIGIKSTRGTANLALWVHPMNQLNQAHVGSDTLGQVAPGNKLTKLSSDATQDMRELVKSAESNHQGGQPNLTETGPSQIEGNQDELNRKLAEAGSNPFKVGSGKSGTLKKGGGSLNKKKEGDPTRISKGGKSNKSNRRDRDSATGKTTGSAPMTTRASDSNSKKVNAGKEGMMMDITGTQIGKRKRSLGIPVDGFAKKKFHDEEYVKSEEEGRLPEKRVEGKSEQPQITSTLLMDYTGSGIGSQQEVGSLPGTESPVTPKKATVEEEIDKGDQCEYKQLEGTGEDETIRQWEELTPNLTSKAAKRGSKSGQKDSNTLATHSSSSRERKVSKNKLKQRARREAGRNAAATMEKKISNKSREDYLLEPEVAGENPTSENPVGFLDYSTATGWDEDSDFKEESEQEGDYDSEYDKGDAFWGTSPREADQVDDRRREELRQRQTSPDLTTRGETSGGGKL
ncbi:hypothetical protein ZOSMA_71G00050 [Zostera marina]|uniref:Uncharacterized protein n=1 Tax=Zostera marina TaxID=29655 RepID=A0A0K9NQ73_ZOSMR|nr:hypothetical protein ZOSMA_71G00050 [Zostera marina]